jgi:tripartite-type tricarboxylate transporter receptor subunit TctC
MFRIKPILPAVLLTACLPMMGTAHADDYPSRAVRMVVPFAPGGASDIVGRIIQPRMSQELGQQIVIDNRAGASGNIGVEVAARANPDGYTFLLGNVGTMAINPSIFPKFPVRPVRDFIAVTEVVDVPGALAVHPSVPVNTVKEFVEYTKARPGKLNFASSGSGSAQRMEMEIFMRAAGINLVHIPYKGGAGAATTALVSGEVSVAVVSLAAVLPHIKSGRIKALGVISTRRFALLPETPTMIETGFPTIRSGSWQGVYLPLGTPRAIVNKLYQVTMRVMADPEVVRRLNESGAEIITSKSPEDFTQFMKVQNDRFARIVKEVGVVTE